MSDLLKGYLGFLIMHLVSQQELSGNQLVEKIHERKGNRLSPGTIYPALNTLKKKGYVQITRKVDKEKIYSLTSDGKNELNSAKNLFKEIFHDI